MSKTVTLKKSRILPQTYSTQTQEQNKESFMKKLKIDFPTSKRGLLLGLELSAVDSPDNMIKEETLLALEANRIYTLVIGQNPHPNSFKYVYFLDPKYKSDIEKIVDLFIWPEEDRELSKMHYGTVSISKSNKNIEAYDAHKEEGNGFISKLNSHWRLFADIIRAEEAYKFVYDWKHLCQNAMDRSYTS